MSDLKDNLAAVRDRIARAADRARRDPGTVTLLAVTKVFPATVIQDAYDLGLREFGENYVQEFEGKAPDVASLPGARFHLIGHADRAQPCLTGIRLDGGEDNPRPIRRPRVRSADLEAHALRQSLEAASVRKLQIEQA